MCRLRLTEEVVICMGSAGTKLIEKEEEKSFLSTAHCKARFFVLWCEHWETICTTKRNVGRY